MPMWYVAPLARIGAGDVELAGGKGANLGELMRTGFPVPDGFVLSTRLYRDALRSAGLCGGIVTHGSQGRTADPARLRAGIETMTIPAVDGGGDSGGLSEAG